MYHLNSRWLQFPNLPFRERPFSCRIKSLRAPVQASFLISHTARPKSYRTDSLISHVNSYTPISVNPYRDDIGSKCGILMFTRWTWRPHCLETKWLYNCTGMSMLSSGRSCSQLRLYNCAIIRDIKTIEASTLSICKKTPLV